MQAPRIFQDNAYPGVHQFLYGIGDGDLANVRFIQYLPHLPTADAFQARHWTRFSRSFACQPICGLALKRPHLNCSRCVLRRAYYGGLRKVPVAPIVLYIHNFWYALYASKLNRVWRFRYELSRLLLRFGARIYGMHRLLKIAKAVLSVAEVICA